MSIASITSKEALAWAVETNSRADNVMTIAGACRYYSAAHVDPPGGSMQGSFQMMKANSSNEHFDAVVGQTPFIGPSTHR